MAEQEQSIFNEKATRKLRSPDDLDKFVRVTNPSLWVVLAACIALLAGLLAWGFFGTVATSVSTTGVCIEGQPMCFLTADESAKVDEGDVAIVDGKKMNVESISAVPVSREEAETILESDFLAETLIQEAWSYQVLFDGEVDSAKDGMPLDVSITVERLAPISIMLGRS